jgi:tetratricopeptide (TPR) repeat protein
MKKHYFLSLLIVTLALTFTGSSYAQKKYVNKAFSWAQQGVKLDTALKALNVAATNDETKDWAKTYYTYALVYKAIGSSQTSEFQNLVDHPFIYAFDNFKKTYYMEGGKAFKTDIDFTLTSLSGLLINKGIEAYNAQDFAIAYKYFDKSVEASQMPIFGGAIDTALIFNAGLMAQRSSDWDNAIRYYEQSVIYGYGEGDTYALLAESYKAKGDIEAYLNSLKIGFEKYPSNQGLLGYIINYYILEAENTDEAFKYLELAIEKDPTNAHFYSAKGHLYDKMNKKEEAKVNYNKAIELKPDFFEAYYNLGVIYFNEAVALTEDANQIKDNKKYEEAKTIADKKFVESLPYIEKAFELHPEDKFIANTLKNLYYRLKMNDKYEELLKKTE